jgi:hypothetical protein
MRHATLAAFVAAATLAAVPAMSQAPPADPAVPTVMKLQGFGQNFTGIGRGKSGDLEIGIESWSSAEERARLRKALADGGGSALIKALPAAPRVGYVRPLKSGGASVDLKFAAVGDLPDGGRRVLLATGPVTAPADGSKPRADTYEALVIEIHLEKDGTGEGRTGAPERLKLGKQGEVLELEAYGSAPVWISPLKIVSEKR